MIRKINRILCYISFGHPGIPVSYRHINYESSFADEIISREERGEQSKIMLVITEIGPAPHTDWEPLGKQGLVLGDRRYDEESSLQNTICLCQMSSKTPEHCNLKLSLFPEV